MMAERKFAIYRMENGHKIYANIGGHSAQPTWLEPSRIVRERTRLLKAGIHTLVELDEQWTQNHQAKQVKA